MSSHRTHAILAAVALLVGACGGPAESGSPSPSTAPTSESSAAATSPTSRACPAEPAPVPATTTRWWHDRVFYEIFVRSFADSDGDGIGDLQGLISRLDSLNDGDPSTTDDLGVTALWLMPIDRRSDVADSSGLWSPCGRHIYSVRSLWRAAPKSESLAWIDLSVGPRPPPSGDSAPDPSRRGR